VSAFRARSTGMTRSLAMVLILTLGACSGEDDSASDESAEGEGEAPTGEVVDPPFTVAGEAEGLVLTWYDEDGPHVAERRSDIPLAAREHVKVDSLSLAPDERDPDAVYVADLRSPGEGQSYEVRLFDRTGFDALLDGMHGTEPLADASVVVYGASWCGACRQAESWLEANGVPFVEKDIEEDPGARAEMQRKAREAGISASGIPVIDVNGRLLTGFDPGAMQRALDETSAATL
jgi:glutaredoxin